MLKHWLYGRLIFYRTIAHYNNRYRYSTWIYRIALNVAISFYRKDKVRREITNPLPEEIIHFADENDHKEKAANILLLQQFISELKELDRALILLYLEEKSYREMAEILGLTETNIATKISRIKEKLKKKFLTMSPLR